MTEQVQTYNRNQVIRVNYKSRVVLDAKNQANIQILNSSLVHEKA